MVALKKKLWIYALPPRFGLELLRQPFPAVSLAGNGRRLYGTLHAGLKTEPGLSVEPKEFTAIDWFSL